ncbi:MAG TPA: AbrB/MazE/SpoVT family DNA-binding domain-containing protein [Polyangiaceae bacterium]|nr:AbrB/MazE/SpoVT family DNA-binding domain-containing protein [Polyangiaceae bacterium]
MAKVTSKLQVTLPKALATQYGIRPGDEILWVASGEAIRVIPARKVSKNASIEERLKLFEQSVERRRRRYRSSSGPEPSDRGWTREELYDRGRPR